ncbi:hypothetical protein B5F13_13805 [Drancourtella sp. An177]|nr:hypothetical protein B5F13_13805 [Drancourtella sp. An177]
MRVWIDKENEMYPNAEWNDSYIFTLTRKKYSTIFSGITDIWYRMDCMALPEIYEDLFVIGISVFAIDKRVSRRLFPDCWTRELSVSIPVLQMRKWSGTEEYWNRTLGFLTGDKWDVHFRQCEKMYSKRKYPNRIHLDIKGCDCICLFSGGLDSFCGAIKLLEEEKSPCLVGHNEYPKLRSKQENFALTFQKIYSNQKVQFVGFSANSRAPITMNGERLEKHEDTSRGRSLLFLCAALSIAGILGNDMPVYIPENGFIGLNIPLTNSRKGTCSTRTTHPYFLGLFLDILHMVGINNPIQNFYAYSTKREIVNGVKNTEAFKNHYMDTISCSHPCLARYDKKRNSDYPINCGYCYPCLIRKSSLLDIKDFRYWYTEGVSEFLKNNSNNQKANDLRAVISTLYRYKKNQDEDLKDMIRCSGKLDEESVQKFLRVYKSTMADLIELLSEDDEIKKFIGESCAGTD